MKEALPFFEQLEIVRQHLKNYEDEVVRNIKIIGKKDSDGEYAFLFFPEYSQGFLSWGIAYLKKQNMDVSEIEKEFKRINEKLDKYKLENLSSYLDHEYYVLEYMIKHYKQDDFLFADPYDFESVIEHRTQIELLAEDLSKYIDVTEDMRQVREKDEIFKEKIWEAKKKKVYSPEDSVEAPSHYWWLHLEEVYGEPEGFVEV